MGWNTCSPWSCFLLRLGVVQERGLWLVELLFNTVLILPLNFFSVISFFCFFLQVISIGITAQRSHSSEDLLNLTIHQTIFIFWQWLLLLNLPSFLAWNQQQTWVYFCFNWSVKMKFLSIVGKLMSHSWRWNSSIRNVKFTFKNIIIIIINKDKISM